MSHLENVKNQLKQLLPELSERFYVDHIGLFGSIVRNDFNNQSDIDIIVNFSQPVGIEFIDLADFLESHLKRKIDLISTKGIKPNYLSEIEKDIIYV